MASLASSIDSSFTSAADEVVSSGNRSEGCGPGRCLQKKVTGWCPILMVKVRGRGWGRTDSECRPTWKSHRPRLVDAHISITTRKCPRSLSYASSRSLLHNPTWHWAESPRAHQNQPLPQARRYGSASTRAPMPTRLMNPKAPANPPSRRLRPRPVQAPPLTPQKKSSVNATPLIC